MGIYYLLAACFEGVYRSSDADDWVLGWRPGWAITTMGIDLYPVSMVSGWSDANEAGPPYTLGYPTARALAPG